MQQMLKCSKWNAANEMQHMLKCSTCTTTFTVFEMQKVLSTATHIWYFCHRITIFGSWSFGLGIFFSFFFSAFEQLFAVFAFLSSFISLQVFHFPFLAYFNALVVVVFFLCNQCPCHTCTGTRASTARSCSTPRQSASARRWTAKPSACGTTCVMLFIFVVTAKS